MLCPTELRARDIGRAALAALSPGEPARVFAAFERSCYVETRAGIACIGGAALGRGPLNVIVDDGAMIPPIGSRVKLVLDDASLWTPAAQAQSSCAAPARLISEFFSRWSANRLAQAFLEWLAGGARLPAPRAADALIGLGPGLTPAGDDFVGGAMIALRAFGRDPLADRVAAWALPLAESRTGRISRAHLRCAALGEGHEALHRLLSALNDGESAVARALDALARVGHTSGLDAAAGALLAPAD